MVESNENDTGVLCKLAAPSALRFEAVGRWYEAHCLRRQHKQTLSSQLVVSSSSDEDVDIVTDDKDDALLYGLDPTEWKKQDHYAVLGLRTLRSDATAEQIKRAYKRKVLRHHPDKRRARGIAVKEGDDDYFTCITRAYETLGNVTKRRSYDSIDPEFDNSVPSKEQASDNRFYEVFTPAFKRNSKWSVESNVPLLGDDSSSYETVCNFYSFWYDFESWREFSYLDEEEKEKGENRDERRWIDKQNKAARQKLKREETARIRQLVDNAYATDPRIQRFKDEEKAKKLAQKRLKQEAVRAKQEAEEKLKREAEEAERLRREAAEEEARAQTALAKKKKEEQKRMWKKEKMALRTYAANFKSFTKDGCDGTKNAADIERLIDGLSLERLQNLNKVLSTANHDAACDAFANELAEHNREKQREKREMLESLHKRSNDVALNSKSSGKEWSDTEIQYLIKGVNVFPAGTQDRWDVIANFINQHILDSSRSPKEVLAKAKNLQQNDTFLKTNASQKAFENFEKERKSAPVASAPSQRVETIADQQIRETGSNPAAWSGDEQKLLEQALKTFPASVTDRWDRIAEVVATRSKKDCMRRYKELAELIKAKKAAQEATRAKRS